MMGNDAKGGTPIFEDTDLQVIFTACAFIGLSMSTAHTPKQAAEQAVERGKHLTQVYIANRNIPLHQNQGQIPMTVPQMEAMLRGMQNQNVNGK